MPFSSSTSVDAGPLLQYETDGYMVAPETLVWPKPRPWPISCTITPSMYISLEQLASPAEVQA